MMTAFSMLCFVPNERPHRNQLIHLLRTLKSIFCVVAIPFLMFACASDMQNQQVIQAESAADRINPQNWPLQKPVIARDPEMEQRISGLMSRMTLEEKVGQVIQADIASVTPDEVREFLALKGLPEVGF